MSKWDKEGRKMIDINAPLRERAEYVLSRTFRGLHHIDAHRIKWQGSSCVYNAMDGISTFDYDELTRLVYFAHEACIRVAICASGPRMIKLRISPRYSRDGGINERHPTIEQAIKTMRAEG